VCIYIYLTFAKIGPQKFCLNRGLKSCLCSRLLNINEAKIVAICIILGSHDVCNVYD